MQGFSVMLVTAQRSSVAKQRKQTESTNLIKHGSYMVIQDKRKEREAYLIFSDSYTTMTYYQDMYIYCMYTYRIPSVWARFSAAIGGLADLKASSVCMRAGT